MFKVAHRNGTGILSEYYTDDDGIPSFDEAKEIARQLREDCPEVDGWYRIIGVIDKNNDTVVWSPDFDFDN